MKMFKLYYAYVLRLVSNISVIILGEAYVFLEPGLLVHKHVIYKYNTVMKHQSEVL